jgi:hypothetical protein
MTGLLPPSSTLAITKAALETRKSTEPSSTLVWGRENIGVGLLRALRSNRIIEFRDGAETVSADLNGRRHLVVCEAGEPLSEVIAANYAFSLDADLALIPSVSKDTAKEVTETLYSLYDHRGQSATDLLTQLVEDVRRLCPNVYPQSGGSLTIFTSHIPYGMAFPEVPSSHLEIYPDLGVAVLNGLAAGNTEELGVRCAVLVDPGEAEAAEIKAVVRSLAKRRVFVRGYPSKTANVRDITNTVELFPYDFLLFATHCGDADGYRFTYRFSDSSGRERELVIDTAIGIGRTDDPDMLNVLTYQRFHELDGVSWGDPEKSSKVVVGTAIEDYMRLNRERILEPVKREIIPRVLGSAALKMHDHNYLAMPRELADHGAPIIFNNACASWHELSGRFMFAGARAYIGTLFPVTEAEAAQVASKFIEHDGAMTLAEALWQAQNDTYGESTARRPYVVTGVYPQSLHIVDDDVPRYIAGRLQAALNAWSTHVAREESDRRAVQEIVRYYRSEIVHFKRKWRLPEPRKRKKGGKKLFRP